MIGKNTVKFKFALGVRVKDITCGFEGIITSRTQCLNGCLQYAVTPKVKDSGERQEAWYVDEAQIVEIDKGIHKKVETKPAKKATGGPATRVSSIRV